MFTYLSAIDHSGWTDGWDYESSCLANSFLMVSCLLKEDKKEEKRRKINILKYICIMSSMSFLCPTEIVWSLAWIGPSQTKSEGLKERQILTHSCRPHLHLKQILLLSKCHRCYKWWVNHYRIQRKNATISCESSIVCIIRNSKTLSKRLVHVTNQPGLMLQIHQLTRKFLPRLGSLSAVEQQSKSCHD